MKKLLLLVGLGISTFIPSAFAAQADGISPIVPQPTECIASRFSTTGNYWKTVTLRLTNECNQTVDFQNSTITFANRYPLNTEFWGRFYPLAYPDNELKITSVATGNTHLSTLMLHFPTTGNSKLPAGASIRIIYGTQADGHLGAASVYLGTTSPTTGNIELTNATAKPANVVQDYAVVHVTANGQNISDVQLPWSGVKTVSGLAAGSYNLTADSVTASTGAVYHGTATPATVNVTANATVKSTVSYAATQQVGSLAIALQALPGQLAGYTQKPVVSVIQSDTGSSVPATLTWGSSTTVSQLKSGSTYRFSTPVISFNGYTCQPAFNPTTVVASATTAPSTSLTYTCTQAAQSRVTIIFS